ncbi:hypothetical protein CTA1_109 [Colletotrichum tanaceti]|uniref:Uncharacterized protein n=1 Tax=Colletotrichum tanaceti TaxID=1306861 RepID=A0A4U6XIK8_9PEZI|nr:hypothetical protein CTA1_109 [Colletotrichum tanaceti]
MPYCETITAPPEVKTRILSCLEQLAVPLAASLNELRPTTEADWADAEAGGPVPHVATRREQTAAPLHHLFFHLDKRAEFAPETKRTLAEMTARLVRAAAIRPEQPALDATACCTTTRAGGRVSPISRCCSDPWTTPTSRAPTLVDRLRVDMAKQLAEHAPDPNDKDAVTRLKAMLRSWAECPVEDFRSAARDLLDKLQRGFGKEWFNTGEDLEWASSDSDCVSEMED